jgi:hypothetical protein
MPPLPLAARLYWTTARAADLVVGVLAKINHIRSVSRQPSRSYKAAKDRSSGMEET